MTSAREKKLRKIAEFAKDALDAEVGKLVEARRIESERNAELAQARANVMAGIGRRDSALKCAVLPDEWAGLEAWIATLRKREAAALVLRNQATEQVELARVRVVDAQNKLRRIEAVVERVLKANHVAAMRVERRLEDEFSAQSARKRADQRSR